jgi:hypothetical protein
MLTQAEAQARVARGAALLDRHRPGWIRAVSLSRLELRSQCSCVLGQLEGSFDLACQRLFPGTVKPFHVGFNVDTDLDIDEDAENLVAEIEGGYAVLQAAWEALIMARRRDERDAPVQTWTMRERTGELVR